MTLKDKDGVEDKYEAVLLDKDFRVISFGPAKKLEHSVLNTEVPRGAKIKYVISVVYYRSSASEFFHKMHRRNLLDLFCKLNYKDLFPLLESDDEQLVAVAAAAERIYRRDTDCKGVMERFEDQERKKLEDDAETERL